VILVAKLGAPALELHRRGIRIHRVDPQARDALVAKVRRVLAAALDEDHRQDFGNAH
jgi:hypothetical protein